MGTRPRYAWFWQPGTGKTLLNLFRQQARPLRTLVLAQKSIIHTAWVDDASKLDMPIVVARHKNRAKRIELIRAPGDHVLVTNYEQFRNHAREFMDSGIERLVVDESGKVKNRETKTFQSVVQLADRCKEVYILNGTPAPNCYTELWAQLRVVSPDAVGRDFYKWAYHWFTPRYDWVRNKRVVAGWTLKPDREEAFFESVALWSSTLRKSDCGDLPEQTDQVRKFTLSKPERDAYNGVADELTIALPTTFGGSSRVSIQAAGVMMKLRQISGGSILMEGRAHVLGNSKLAELKSVFEEYGRDPMVIWAEFTADIDRIAGAVREFYGCDAAVIDGRTKREIGDIVKDFQRGLIHKIIAHPASAGHGTDGLQDVCKCALYYGLSYSSDQHNQSRDRIHRTGQKNPCTYIYLIAEDTLDEVLYPVVHGKMKIQEGMLKELNRINSKRR